MLTVGSVLTEVATGRPWRVESITADHVTASSCGKTMKFLRSHVERLIAAGLVR